MIVMINKIINSINSSEFRISNSEIFNRNYFFKINSILSILYIFLTFNKQLVRINQ